MFDVGFSEMLVIAVVALVVIGPEKLPGVAKTVGSWFGRLQRYVNDVKADINREIELTSPLGQALERNLCRCGTHTRIIRAVRRAAGATA